MHNNVIRPGDNENPGQASWTYGDADATHALDTCTVMCQARLQTTYDSCGGLSIRSDDKALPAPGGLPAIVSVHIALYFSVQLRMVSFIVACRVTLMATTQSVSGELGDQ